MVQPQANVWDKQKSNSSYSLQLKPTYIQPNKNTSHEMLSLGHDDANSKEFEEKQD
jgi:hypothetical protein